MTTEPQIGLRYFFVDDADRVSRLSRADMDRLIGRKRITKLAGIPRLRYLQVIVYRAGRHVVGVHRVDAHTMELDGKGGLDERAWLEHSRDALGSVDLGLSTPLPATAGPTVIDAKRAFTKRMREYAAKRYRDKYHWRPSEAVLAQVRTLLFGD